MLHFRLVRLLIFMVFCWYCVQPAGAQAWIERMTDPKADFYEIQAEFNAYWANRTYERGKGWKPFKRWENFMEPRVYPSGKRPPANLAWDETLRFRRSYPNPAGWRAGNWTPLGPAVWQSSSYNPGNGRINVILRDPNNVNTLYVGTPSGGLWKSADGGSSWSCLTDHLPVIGVSAIAIPASNSNTIYIGTGDGDASDTYSIGVLKSTDGGATWNPTGLNWAVTGNRLIRRMVIHPTDPNTLWLVSNVGIFKTTNGGDTWTQSLSGTSFFDIEIKPGDPNTLYAAGRRFYRSIDGGNSWTQITMGVPAQSSVNRMSIAVSPNQPNWIYLLAGDNADSGFYGLYRSTDSGLSFSLQSNSPNIMGGSDDGSSSGGQSWYDIAMAVSPTNAQELYVGGINVWKSTDAGQNWQIKSHWVYPSALGYTHADIHWLDFFGSSLFCGSDGGVFRSNNGGDNWTDLSAGLEITQFYRMGGTPQNPNLLLAGSQDNGSYRYNAGTWTHILGADGMEALIDYSDPQILYCAIQNGGLRRSTNGGNSFTNIVSSIGEPGAWVTPYVIDPVNPQTLYLGLIDMWKTTNRGNTWAQISNFGNTAYLRSVAVAPSNPQVLYAATYTKIYRSDDGGGTWTEITAGLPSSSISYIAVHPNDPQTLYLTLSGYAAGNKVMKTTNGGATWSNISTNLPNLPANCIAYQAGSPEGLYVGTDVGVYYKDSTLSNWVAFMDGLPNVVVSELEIHYGANKLRAATFGRGIWETPLYTPSALPPVANFSMRAEQLCPTDSVRFQDLSVYAAPAWQWFFPGGSPASSSLPNPSVFYASEGSYDVTLVVGNANGNDTLVQTITVDFADNPLTLQLRTDAYPEETSWEITDLNGNVVLSGEGYDLTNTLYTQSFCLDNGCYFFTIYDGYGDGICCAYGNGYFNLLDGNGNNLGTGGTFTASQTVQFCFNSVAPLQILNTSGTFAGCGLSNGSLTVQATGGTGGNQYSIDGGGTWQSSNVFTGLAAGSYTVQVRDGSGNVATATGTVPLSNTPTAIASSNVSSAQLSAQGTAVVSFFSTGTTGGTTLSWNFGDGLPNSPLPNPNRTFTAAGIYTVVLSATLNGCVGRDTLEIEITPFVDVQTASGTAGIEWQLMPNPVRDRLTVEAEWKGKLEGEVLIFNMLGQPVLVQRFDAADRLQLSLHTGNLPDGAYTALLRTDQFSLCKGFVKQR